MPKQPLTVHFPDGTSMNPFPFAPENSMYPAAIIKIDDNNAIHRFDFLRAEKHPTRKGVTKLYLVSLQEEKKKYILVNADLDKVYEKFQA